MVWRRLHYLNFAVWIAATGHGLGAGTDAGAGWFLTLYVATTTAIILLAIRRFSRSQQPTNRPGPRETVALEAGNT